MNRQEASVTVFFALIFVLLLSLILSLLESVRIRTGRIYYQMALASAVESVEAGYCRELFEEYGLLFYWVNDASLAERCETYLSYYEDPSMDLPVHGIELYTLKNAAVKTQGILRAGDNGASALRKQMIQDVPYQEGAALLEKLLPETEAIRQGQALDQQMQEAKTSYDNTDWYDMAEKVLIPDNLRETPEADKGSEEESEKLPEEGQGPENQRETEGRQGSENQQEAASQQEAEAEQEKEGQQGGLSREDWDSQMQENMEDSFFQQLREWITHPILSLVLPENVSISPGDVSGKMSELHFFAEEKLEPVQVSSGVEHVLIDLYVMKHTGDFLNPASGDGLAYELEYVLSGKDSDEKNLSETVNQLLLLREAVNLIWFVQDEESMELVSGIADTLVGWTLLPVLVEVVKLVLISAWTFAESALDVKKLLSGGQVPFLKSKDDWELTLDRLTEWLSGAGEIQTAHSKGLDYAEYMQILLFLQEEAQTVNRMGTLIQFHMQQYNPEFCLLDCVSEADVIFEGALTHGFIRIPVGQAMGDGMYGFVFTRKLSFED